MELLWYIYVIGAVIMYLVCLIWERRYEKKLIVQDLFIALAIAVLWPFVVSTELIDRVSDKKTKPKK